MSIRNYIKKGKYDQNGEHGLLMECIKRLDLAGDAVEFGAPTMEYCSNIFGLPETFKKAFYDIDPTDVRVNKATITPENVNEVIGGCDILSVDIDGNDFAVWKAYTYAPAVVIIEINSSIKPDVDHSSLKHGTSFYTMNELAKSKGYFLLCHTGNNVYIRNDFINLFPDRDETFMTDWLC